MVDIERKELYMNRNIKLSPSIVALTWDVIFVWTITTLYFTSVKGLTNSQIVWLDSILMLFGCIFCVPVGKLFQNIKSTTAIRIGLFGYAAYLLLCIFGTNYFTFIFAQPFLAFGYAIMSVKVNTFLNQSLANVKRDKDYQKIYGKGLSVYYVIECIGAILITYVYNWKPYMVYWIALIIVGITLILTTLLKEPSKYMESNVNLTATSTKQVNKKPDSFKKIINSGFLISMLVYCFFYRGILSVTGSAYRIYLNELIFTNTIPLWSFGYFYALSRLCAAISSKFQFKFNLKFGLRSLLIFNVVVVLGYVGVGIFYLINPTSIIGIIIIVILSCLLCAVRLPNQIFINNYLQVCTHKRNVERVYSIRTMVEYLGYALISFVFSGLLSLYNDNFGLTCLTYIGIFAIPLIISLIFFIKQLTKKYAQKYTIVKDEYVND